MDAERKANPLADMKALLRECRDWYAASGKAIDREPESAMRRRIEIALGEEADLTKTNDLNAPVWPGAGSGDNFEESDDE